MYSSVRMSSSGAAASEVYNFIFTKSNAKMENLPISSIAQSAAHRNSGAVPSGNNFVAAALAAAAAAASQQHFFNAAIRAAAASTAPSTVQTLDHGSGDSPSPLSVQLDYTPESAEAKLIDYRQEKVAAFEIDGETMMCLPQAYEFFLKNLVGGLHTVYTKLKRLDIAPFVCNVEQVRALRSIGAIQPGVNRCKLISCRDFDVLYEDCASSSSRPGRPPKRSPVFSSSSASIQSASLLPPGSVASNNFPVGGGSVGSGFGFGADNAPAAKRARLNQAAAGNVLDKLAMNPMAGLMNTAAAGANSLSPSQLFPLFPFPQNFMLSQLVNTNPNAALLAKHWGDHFNNLSANGVDNSNPIDATIKGAGTPFNQTVEKVGSTMCVNRADRNASWSSVSGRDSDEFMKYSNEPGANSDECSDNLPVSRGVGIMVNGDFGRHQSGHGETGRNSSDFEETNGHHLPVDDEEPKEVEKQEDGDQRQWTNVSNATSNGGIEASQLLRSMADLGVNAMNSSFFCGQASAFQHGRQQRPSSIPEQMQNEALHYSSVENILFSVLGLVQVAASTARMHEEQLMKEKLEAVKLYETEKQEKTRLEQLLRDERRSKAACLRSLKKERKQRAKITEKMLAMAEEIGKQKNVGHGLSQDVTQVNSMKSPPVAVGGQTNSVEASQLFYAPKIPAATFNSKFEAFGGDRRQRTSGDGQHDVTAGNFMLPRLMIDSKAGPDPTDASRNEDILESYSDLRGRTATLFVKHELS